MSERQGLVPGLYACGGMYEEKHNPKTMVFRLVKPSQGTAPYVSSEKDAARLFNLCQHHAHLYQLGRDILPAMNCRASRTSTIG